jgi:hypothetical protein
MSRNTPAKSTNKENTLATAAAMQANQFHFNSVLKTFRKYTSAWPIPTPFLAIARFTVAMSSRFCEMASAYLFVNITLINSPTHPTQMLIIAINLIRPLRIRTSALAYESVGTSLSEEASDVLSVNHAPYFSDAPIVTIRPNDYDDSSRFGHLSPAWCHSAASPRASEGGSDKRASLRTV